MPLPLCKHGSTCAEYCVQCVPQTSGAAVPSDGTDSTGGCCDNGTFEDKHVCRKQPGEPTNGAGVPVRKLSNRGTGAAMHQDKQKLHAKHPSSIARKFKAVGLDWATDFALAIKANNRARIKLWLRLLPYLITTSNKAKVRKWKGKASRAAIVALETLEGRGE